MSRIVVDTGVASYLFNWHSLAQQYADALRGSEPILSFAAWSRGRAERRDGSRLNIAVQFPHQSINWSTDCQLDRLAGTAEHFHERIDGELGRLFVHHVGHTRARDHQNLGGLGLL